MPDQDSLLAEVTRRWRAKMGFSLATVNLDHLVKMTSDAAFAHTYAQQDLVVADGRPIVWLSHLAKRPVTLVPGSELVVPLCQAAANCGVKVALVGSTEEALRDAASVLKGVARPLDIRIMISPAFGFDPHSDEAKDILATVSDADVGLCLIALGAPKQEQFAELGRVLAPQVGFASIGAGLDFLGGHQQRAPLWMRRMSLEWLWRALSNPLRLGPRYLRCLALLPTQAWAAIKLRNTA